MRITSLVLVSILLALTAACQQPAEEAEPASSAATASTESPAAAAEPAGPASSPAVPAAEPAPATAPVAPGAVLASQETNWQGIVAEVTEFRRKGNTLTAKVRLRNQGSAAIQPEVIYKEVYLMDLGAGKKYEVLRDEKGAYIAALKSGWSERWYGEIEPGQSYTLWVKFPAPPPEVKSVTLQVPGVPPFEDLAIQDS
ncbi:MAG TPA: hypothetical protein VN493_12540 [Thermoanaerobaculia bacterium]|nr:hypothetical protein [Thermoanaerobaculia bacterium]